MEEDSISLACKCCGSLYSSENIATPDPLIPENDPEDTIYETSIEFPAAFYEVFDFKQLNEKTARDSIPLLEDAVKDLGMERFMGRYVETKVLNKAEVGNFCNDLLRWASIVVTEEENPDAYIWSV